MTVDGGGGEGAAERTLLINPRARGLEDAGDRDLDVDAIVALLQVCEELIPGGCGAGRSGSVGNARIVAASVLVCPSAARTVSTRVLRAGMVSIGRAPAPDEGLVAPVVGCAPGGSASVTTTGRSVGLVIRSRWTTSGCSGSGT